MHNLNTVFLFEVVRSLKKKSFWIISLAFPVGIAAIFAVVYFSNTATEQASKDAAKSKFSIEVLDESGMLSKQIIKSVKASEVADKEQGIADVMNGKVDSFIYYPEDMTKESIEVYGKDVGIFDNSKYDAVAKSLIQTSVAMTTNPDVATVLSGTAKANSVIYKDGAVYDPIKEMIAPAIFLVLFYMMIATFGSQMLNATVEEKENRVIEMILTTIEARTLIVAKIFSLIVLGVLQMLLVLIPVAIMYFVLHDKLQLPDLDLNSIDFNWLRMTIGFVIFALSFILFTGLLVAVGAIMPTAKEAGSVLGIVYVALFAPLYAVTLFVSSPHSAIVQFLSYFPLTAPIPLMLRNAVGNLTTPEALIAIAILLVSSVFAIWIGIKAFKYGALEYDRKVNIFSVLKR